MSDIRKPLPATLVVRVTYTGGTYQTQTVRGQRASSTSSAFRAAQALATKLWPHHPATARELPAKGLRAGASLWCLTRIDNAQATVATNGASRGEAQPLQSRDAAVASPPAAVPAGGDVTPETTAHMQSILTGALLVEELLLPGVMEATAAMTPDHRMRLFAGAMSAVVGASCARIGSDATVTMLRNMVGTAGRIEADLVGRH